jgi:DNA-binding CsgD family transcriptional regulator/tetratricopeptide (TPR) repeat protein
MILERDRELATLNSLVDELESSGGKVVLVRGEAGIGKSALVAEFARQQEKRAHVLQGGSDDLLTPQPLGAFWDIAREAASVDAQIRAGDRRGVMEAVLDLLSRRLRPTIIILEDTHWADEATLDAVKFLGRRITRTNGVLVLTYRDGEVDAEHPLRQVIGELPPLNLVRIQLQPLSEDGIASLIDDDSLDAGEVFALTDGNPLFVTEIIASGLDTVPASIQDFVLARAAKISPEARSVLDLVSVFPTDAELTLVDEILHPAPDELSECVRQGLLRVERDTVAFHHAVTRQAIESALSPADRQEINTMVLSALGATADPSRLVHHAREAHDEDAIIRFAPIAARNATAIESHREALAHFRTLEPFLDHLEDAERASLFDDWAQAAHSLDDPECVKLQDSAIELWRSLDDARALARALTYGARVKRTFSQNETALAYANEAVEILEPTAPSEDLAVALVGLALVEWAGDGGNLHVSSLADRALQMATETDDELTMIRAMSLKGGVDFDSGESSGMTLLEESLDRAQKAGYHWEEATTLIGMAAACGDVRDVARGVDLARRTRDTAARYDLGTLEAEGAVIYSEFLQWQGRWPEAENMAAEALDASPKISVGAWRVLGNIQARMGRSEAAPTLSRMWDLARQSDAITILDPAAGVMAEHLWLTEADDPALTAELVSILDRGLGVGSPWPSAAFAFWMWMLGLAEEVSPHLSDFYRWIMEGDWETAADFWETRGVPYERGLALMHGDEEAKLRAVRIFDDLGALATASRLRRELADRGVKVPRGRSQTTREHGAGLTARQAEVLDLLAEGLTNAEIADRLFVSHRTVENHVAAVLMKLDVPTRESAIDEAVKRGLIVR